MDPSFMGRYLNDGFSGGEKKRLEMLQLAVLAPKYADPRRDRFRTRRRRAQGRLRLRCNALRASDEGRSAGFLIITHYPRILQYVVPDVVHVMIDGRIVKTGGHDLAASDRKRRATIRFAKRSALLPNAIALGEDLHRRLGRIRPWRSLARGTSASARPVLHAAERSRAYRPLLADRSGNDRSGRGHDRGPGRCDDDPKPAPAAYWPATLKRRRAIIPRSLRARLAPRRPVRRNSAR